MISKYNTVWAVIVHRFDLILNLLNYSWINLVFSASVFFSLYLLLFIFIYSFLESIQFVEAHILQVGVFDYNWPLYLLYCSNKTKKKLFLKPVNFHFVFLKKERESAHSIHGIKKYIVTRISLLREKISTFSRSGFCCTCRTLLLRHCQTGYDAF